MSAVVRNCCLRSEDSAQTICQHLMGDVRTEKRERNVRNKEWCSQNNILNISMMRICVFLRIRSVNIAIVVKMPTLINIEISLHHTHLRERGCLQSTVYSPKMIDYYLDVIIYIINLFSQSQRSVNNGL